LKTPADGIGAAAKKQDFGMSSLAVREGKLHPFRVRLEGTSMSLRHRSELRLRPL